MSQARALIDRLAPLGVDFADVTATLLKVGVERFSTDFEKLLASVAEKRSRILAEK
jgi:transaldolase